MKRFVCAILGLAMLLAVGFSEKVFAGIDTVQTFPTVIGGEKRGGTK